MLWTLLTKDFRRMVRNPWPLVLNLALPIAITALVGIAFGGGGTAGPSVARIRVAIVDQDESLLGSLFKSALTQGDASKYFEITTPSRDEAVRLLQNDKISAALIVPPSFTRDYLRGRTNLHLQILKNPAQSFYPAIVEELCAVAVTGLSAVSRNLQSEFPAIDSMLTGEMDFSKLAELFAHLSNRVKGFKEYVVPPILTFQRETIARSKIESSDKAVNVFAIVLPGMASAFLLFLADHSLRDLHREKRQKTLDRIRSIVTGTGTFVASKVLMASITVILGSAILFTIGAVVFEIRWGNPILMALVCVAYSFFAAGFLSALIAFAPSEKRSETLNTMVLFLFAFAGGSYFPANSLPAFMREHICPLIPNYWFIEALRSLQTGGGLGTPVLVVLKLAGAGAALAVIASIVLQRRLSKGARA